MPFEHGSVESELMELRDRVLNRCLIAVKFSRSIDMEAAMEWLKKNRGWMFPLGVGILGLGALFCSFYFFSPNQYGLYPKLALGLRQAGTALLAGGICTGILKSLQFMGIYSEEIRKIFSHKDTRGERQGDIFTIFSNRCFDSIFNREDAWKTATMALLESKISDSCIIEEITGDVLNKYLPIAQGRYVTDITDIVEIYWIDEEKGVYRIVDDLSYRIHPTSIDGTTLTYNYSERRLDDINSHKITYLKTKGASDSEDQWVDHSGIIENIDDPKNIRTKYSFTVSGRDEFCFHRKSETVSSLAVEPFQKSTLKTITKVVNLTVIHPNTMNVDFESLGTRDMFNVTKTEQNGCLVAKARGVLFSGDGYILVFSRYDEAEQGTNANTDVQQQ
jgi:hypothetical protein